MRESLLVLYCVPIRLKMFNRKDFIFRRKKVFSERDCEHAINFFETNHYLQEPGGVGGRVNFNAKKCTEIYLKRHQYVLFESKLQQCFKDYILEYPLSDILSPWDLSSVFKIQKYKPGEGFFSLHCEADGLGCEEMRRRVHAWMIYLNDVHDGGYTEFPSQDKKFQPRRGDVLIWPAYFTHPHRGIVSKTQTKYIVTGWTNFKILS